jgi:hypothetical protein
MEDKIYNIDSMKYRKSTHLAGVDVEAIIAETGSCCLVIKEAYYAKGVEVSGKKLDGYFIAFVQDQKPMMVNSTNRKTIGNIAKVNKNLTSTESRNIGNWAGLSIELIFEPSVKMKGETVGGIRIKPISPISTLSDKNALDKLNKCESLKELATTWETLTSEEKKITSVLTRKDELKSKLK